MANKEFILGDGENGVVKKTINFPADNSLSIADIVSKLEKNYRGGENVLQI